MKFSHHKYIATKCLLETVYAENVGLRRSVGLLMVAVLAIATCRFVPHSFALAS